MSEIGQVMDLVNNMILKRDEEKLVILYKIWILLAKVDTTTDPEEQKKLFVCVENLVYEAPTALKEPTRSSLVELLNDVNTGLRMLPLRPEVRNSVKCFNEDIRKMIQSLTSRLEGKTTFVARILALALVVIAILGVLSLVGYIAETMRKCFGP